MDSPEMELGSFVATLQYDDIPDDVVQTVLRAFTDTAGVTLAGSAEGAGAVAFENAGVDPDAVERVVVRASQGAVDALHHADPKTGLEAKFSMEYAVASAIVRDRVGLATFEDDAIEQSSVQRVRERVDFAVDPDLHYDSHEAFVRIETTDDVVDDAQTDPLYDLFSRLDEFESPISALRDV